MIVANFSFHMFYHEISSGTTDGKSWGRSDPGHFFQSPPNL